MYSPRSVSMPSSLPCTFPAVLALLLSAGTPARPPMLPSPKVIALAGPSSSLDFPLVLSPAPVPALPLTETVGVVIPVDVEALVDAAPDAEPDADCILSMGKDEQTARNNGS